PAFLLPSLSLIPFSMLKRREMRSNERQLRKIKLYGLRTAPDANAHDHQDEPKRSQRQAPLNQTQMTKAYEQQIDQTGKTPSYRRYCHRQRDCSINAHGS